MSSKSLTKLVSLLSLILFLPHTHAAMSIVGTPDNDGDSDGDTFLDNYTYTVTDEGGVNSMQVDVLGTSGIEYWTTDQLTIPETSFIADPNEALFFAAHLTAPMSNSDLIHVQSDYYFSVDNPKIGFRAPYGLPDNATFYLGLASANPADSFITGDIQGLTGFDGLRVEDPLTGGLGVSPSVVNSYDTWLAFDKVGTGSSDFVFDTKSKGNGTGSGSSLSKWVVYVQLPDANTVGETGSWDDIPPTITPTANDVSFVWTIAGDIDLTTPVPEPSALLTVGMAAAMGIFYRRRTRTA